MHVVSLPRQEWVERFGDVEGVEAVAWDFGGAPPRDDIELAVLAWPMAGDPWPALAELPRLRWVQVLSAGYDYVGDRLPARAALLNGRGVHSAATAELALALVLAAQRELPRYVDAQRREHWDRGDLAPGLADKRVLVVGYGDIGRALAQRLVACEATVVGARREAHGSDGVASEVIAMREVADRLGEFDVVVLLTPLTDETHHLADAGFLARMRDGALLVNVARGPVVDTEALLAELRAGRLRAALDVTDPEPLPDGHPLWSAPGCLVVPHVGGLTDAMEPRTLRLLGEQLRRLGAGEPLANEVVPRREG